MNNSKSHARTSSSTNTTTTPRLTSILGSFLEVLTHEILYIRSLYPHDAFSPTRHYGVSCHACRHLGVVDYIFDTLKVAVPGIISGTVEGVYIILYDSQTDELLERYAVEFQMDEMVNIVNSNDGRGSIQSSTSTKDTNARERDLLEEKVQHLERALRDVLLKMSSLDGTDLGRRRGHATFSSSSTFKLCVRTRRQDEDADASSASLSNQTPTTAICPELEGAMKEGTWFRSDAESCSFTSVAPDIIDDDANMGSRHSNTGDVTNKAGCVTRPLKNVNVPSCGIQLQLLMEFPK